MSTGSPVASDKASGTSKRRLRQDLQTSAMASLLGIGAVAVIDYVATLIVSPGPLRLATSLRLLLLEFTLAACLLILVIPLAFGAALAARVAMRDWRPQEAAQWQGLFGPAGSHSAPSRVASWMWGGCIAGALFLASSTMLTLKLVTIFKEPQLTAFVLAGLQLTM